MDSIIQEITRCLIWTTAFMLANVAFDHIMWKRVLAGKKKKLSKAPRLTIRFVGLVLLTMNYNLAIWIPMYFWFFLWFDPLLSISMGHSFYYLGTTSESDKFLNKKPVQRFYTELVLFVVTTIIYSILRYKNIL